MSTSDRIILVEAAVAALLVCTIIAVASPHDVWLRDFGLHPMWLPTIVLAARYAARGLFPALGLTCGGLVVMSVAFDDSLAGFAARTRNPADLLALSTAVLVAWVAMLHESRIGRAQRRLDDATESQHQAEENVRALHASLRYLRSRQDRLDLSISLWRNIAGRLERGNAMEASRAVLELCEIRAGAHAGIVQLRDGARLVTLATRGQWSMSTPRPQELDNDPAVRAAMASRHVTPASVRSSEVDSDVAIPVTDEESGAVLGVIALRGVSPGSMRAADLRDLGVIAQWLAPAMARELRRQFGKALGELQAAPRKTEVVL